MKLTSESTLQERRGRPNRPPALLAAQSTALLLNPRPRYRRIHILSSVLDFACIDEKRYAPADIIIIAGVGNAGTGPQTFRKTYVVLVLIAGALVLVIVGSVPRQHYERKEDGGKEVRGGSQVTTQQSKSGLSLLATLNPTPSPTSKAPSSDRSHSHRLATHSEH